MDSDNSLGPSNIAPFGDLPDSFPPPSSAAGQSRLSYTAPMVGTPSYGYQVERHTLEGSNEQRRNEPTPQPGQIFTGPLIPHHGGPSDPRSRPILQHSHPYPQMTSYHFSNHAYPHGVSPPYQSQNSGPVHPGLPLPTPPNSHRNSYIHQRNPIANAYRPHIMEARSLHNLPASSSVQLNIDRHTPPNQFGTHHMAPYYPVSFTNQPSTIYSTPYGQYTLPVFTNVRPEELGFTWWHSVPNPNHPLAEAARNGVSGNFAETPNSPIAYGAPVRPEATLHHVTQDHRTISLPVQSSGPSIASSATESSAKRTRQDIADSRFQAKSASLRDAWHPKPSTNRSDWVMWVGNVPADATEDELVDFFGREYRGPNKESRASGVLSAFIIPRSNCAFVNFSTQHLLQKAVQECNGRPLRPANPRSMRLVCRIRKPDDDLKAGVGGQRGIGLHGRWVKDHRHNTKVRDREISSNPGAAEKARSGKRTSIVSNSGSSASTSSSLLATYFPRRYFILKSLTEAELITSQENGTWTTQQHNEPVLNRAYRTSQEVFLIFSANKSGEFFGHARMGGSKASWGQREQQETNPYFQSVDGSSLGPPLMEADLHRPPVLSPTAPLVGESPGSFIPQDGSPQAYVQGGNLATRGREGILGKIYHGAAQTAPAEIGPHHNKLSYDQGATKQMTLEMGRNRKSASIASPHDGNAELINGLPPRPPVGHETLTTTQRAASNDNAATTGVVALGRKGTAEKDRTLGTPFKIQWVRTEKLSFQMTKHLRNPWNHDREVKVSRDGTELEPSVGAALIAEWDKRFPEAR